MTTALWYRPVRSFGEQPENSPKYRSTNQRFRFKLTDHARIQRYTESDCHNRRRIGSAWPFAGFRESHPATSLMQCWSGSGRAESFKGIDQAARSVAGEPLPAYQF